MLRFFLLFPLLLIGLLGAPALRADDTPKPDAPSVDPYTVTGVAVDIEGVSANKARDKAYIEGGRKAFDQMAAGLSAGGKISAKKIGDGTLQNLISSFEVEKEKSSSGRYIATLTFHFRRNAVQDLLSSRGIEVSEDPYAKPASANTGEPVAALLAKPKDLYVVLPILRVNEKALLWESQSVWYRAFMNYLSDNPQADMKVAEGTNEDMRNINAQEALAGMKGPLQKFMQKYGAKGVVVASLLSPNEQPNPTMDLTIQIARFDDKGEMQGTYTVPLYAEYNRRTLDWLQDGAGAALGIMREGMEKNSPTQVMAANTPAPPSQTLTSAVPAAPTQPPSPVMDPHAPVNAFNLSIPFTYPSDWARARSTLQSTSGVNDLSTQRLTSAKAVVRITFKGTRSQLEQVLASKGYQLVEPASPDGTLLLLPNGQTPSGSPAAELQPQYKIVYPQQPAAQPAAGETSPNNPTPDTVDGVETSGDDGDSQ